MITQRDQGHGKIFLRRVLQELDGINKKVWRRFNEIPVRSLRLFWPHIPLNLFIGKRHRYFSPDNLQTSFKCMSSGIPWWRCIFLGMLVGPIFQFRLLLRIVVKDLLHANHEWMEFIDRGSFFLRCNIYSWITARTCVTCPKGKNLLLRPWFHGWGIVRGLKYGSPSEMKKEAINQDIPDQHFLQA